MPPFRMILILALTACASSGQDQQLANPASVFRVEEMKGRLELVTDGDGTRGLCHLPDGTSIDEWQLYRQQQG